MNQQNRWTDFLFGAQFWGKAPKGPQNRKMDSSYSFWAMIFIFSGIIGYLCTNKILERIFHLGPRFRARPEKGPKMEKIDSYSFWARTFIFSGIVGYPWSNRIKKHIYFYFRVFWERSFLVGVPAGCLSAFQDSAFYTLSPKHRHEKI